MSRENIRKIFTDEGFDISPQAIRFLLNASEPEKKAKILIEKAKERKFIISGGDVLKLIYEERELPTSLANSSDIR